VTVIANLQPYPKMKDSGLRWLGNIPDHWDVKRGKSLFRCIDVRSPTGEEELLTVSSERGIVPRSSAKVTMFKAESYVGYKLCWPGDLVINSLWAWGRGLGVSRHHGIVSSAYGVYRLRDPYTEYFSYIHELVRSTPFNWELQVRSKGIWISRLQLTDESFLGAPFPVPPVDEQAAIVRFLEYADQRIRRYIRTKQKLIKLLEEQKQAIIHQAVTRGLDPNVPFKDSGVEWLGNVPEHWQVVKLGYRFRCTSGSTPSRGANGFYNGGIPWIKTGELRGAEIYSSNENITKAALAACSMSLLPVDTLLVAMYGQGQTRGRTGLLKIEATTNQACLAILPNSKSAIPKYLQYWFIAQYPQLRYISDSRNATQPNLNGQMIKDLRLSLPPLKEQSDIVESIKIRTEKLQVTINQANAEIDFLLEYRTRLIADVVTGKLDVRETATRLPNDITDTLEELDVIDEEPGEESELEEDSSAEA
jgi:type I restriction enzyme, S subunit